MLGHHLILRLGDDRVIAPSREARRRIARVLARLSCTLAVLGWKLADTHLHIVVLGGPEVADELVRRLRIWFTTVERPGVPLELQRRKPINSQSHLEAAFRYALGQDDHHGVQTDTFQDASSVVDTLGLRVICPDIAPRVRERLPRLRRSELLRFLGVTELTGAAHLAHLADAAMAAFGLATLGLRGEGARAREAAVAAIIGAPGEGAVSKVEIAGALGITPQAVGRLSTRGAPARDVRAVRLQMALRAARAEHVPFADTNAVAGTA